MIETVYVPLDDLDPDPRNPKRHADDTIRASIGRFGFVDPIIRDDRTGRILSGHGRADALAALRDQGDTAPEGIRVDDDGRWLVPVTTGWSSRSDEEAGAAIVALNRTVEAGGWDDTALLEILETLDDLDGVGYDTDDLDDLRARLEALEDTPDEDPAPAEPPADPTTVVGDLWTVGPHRILCGDSSDPAVLDRLLAGADVGALLTDPPYGINLDTDYSKGTPGRNSSKGRAYRPVHGDDQPFDAGFLATYFDAVAEQWWWGADYYRRTLPAPDLAGSWVVWDKRDEDPDDDTSNWDDALGSTFELAWSRQRHKRAILRHRWTNWTSHSNEGHRREHPTEKPVAVLTEILDRWAPKGCVVADPFAGSGTTLVAAHRTGRVGYGVELDPGYVDVIVARLEQETGETARRLDA